MKFTLPKITFPRIEFPKIKVPTTTVGKMFFFGAAQFLSYFMFVANGRAFTLGLYKWTAITDGFLALNSWTITKMIAKEEAEGFWPCFGYTVGGVCGSLLSVWCTKHVYGH